MINFFRENPFKKRISKEKREQEQTKEAYIILVVNKAINPIREVIQHDQEKLLQLETFRGNLIDYLLSMEEFDEDRIVDYLENIVNQVQDPGLRQQLVEAFFERPQQPQEPQQPQQPQEPTKEPPRRRLKGEFKLKLVEAFLKENKGINWPEYITDQDLIGAFIYLTMPQEASEERDRMKKYLDRAILQRRSGFYLTWRPLFFKKTLKPGEYFKELIDYSRILQQGKVRITLRFPEGLLPEELRGKSKEDLESLGVYKRDGMYEIELDKDKLSRILLEMSTAFAEALFEETEFLKTTRKILEDLNAIDLDRGYKDFFRAVVLGLVDRYRELKERGASTEEYEQIKKGFDQIEKVISQLKTVTEQGRVEEGEGKVEKERRRIIEGFFRGFLPYVGLILSGVGLWALALYWFAPLWLIVKMNKEIGKFVGGK